MYFQQPESYMCTAVLRKAYPRGYRSSVQRYYGNANFPYAPFVTVCSI